MKIHLQVCRQKSTESSGFFETHMVDNITEDMSFFEMLDMLNNNLIKDKKSPIAFDHDCREGICGTCGLVINGRPHGPLKGVTSCQLHMRSFKDGDTLTLEPFRASIFPVVKDLAINRKSFDRILESGGYISVKTGGAPDGNATPILKIMQMKHLILQHVLVVVHVLQHVKIHLLCFCRRKSKSIC